VFQFDGDRVVDGLRTIVREMSPAVATHWTIVSWLTSSQPDLDGDRPIDRLHRGDVTLVVAAARRTAAALSR
jgi:hypothetical protein